MAPGSTAGRPGVIVALRKRERSAPQATSRRGCKPSRSGGGGSEGGDARSPRLYRLGDSLVGSRLVLESVVAFLTDLVARLEQAIPRAAS
jgi:hypothetical protein